MRVAAGLSVYARALAKHIMRPTYILRDDEALEKFAELTKHDRLVMPTFAIEPHHLECGVPRVLSFGCFPCRLLPCLWLRALPLAAVEVSI
jgi:hypothetical protein